MNIFNSVCADCKEILSQKTWEEGAYLQMDVLKAEQQWDVYLV